MCVLAGMEEDGYQTGEDDCTEFSLPQTAKPKKPQRLPTTKKSTVPKKRKMPQAPAQEDFEFVQHAPKKRSRTKAGDGDINRLRAIEEWARATWQSLDGSVPKRQATRKPRTTRPKPKISNHERGPAGEDGQSLAGSGFSGQHDIPVRQFRAGGKTGRTNVN